MTDFIEEFEPVPLHISAYCMQCGMMGGGYSDPANGIEPSCWNCGTTYGRGKGKGNGDEGAAEDFMATERHEGGDHSTCGDWCDGDDPIVPDDPEE